MIDLPWRMAPSGTGKNENPERGLHTLPVSKGYNKDSLTYEGFLSFTPKSIWCHLYSCVSKNHRSFRYCATGRLAKKLYHSSHMRGHTSNTRVHKSTKKYDVMLPDGHSMARSATWRGILTSTRCFDSFPRMGLDIEQPEVAVVVESVLVQR
jgi:hypothetical protein